MQSTPRSNRLHIAILGRRNAGKSSLINALTNQDIALVSDVPGTTTDPVYKAMEILPVGPVVIIDTAGIDDSGQLGEMRVQRTKRVLAKADLAILVVDVTRGVGDYERSILAEARERGVPVIGVANKTDLIGPAAERDRRPAGESAVLPESAARLGALEAQLGISLVPVSSKTGQGLGSLKDRIVREAPKYWEGPPVIGDLVRPGDTVVLVVPVDIEAPKGRLILPQVQTLRDLLDNDARAVVVKENAVRETIEGLRSRPALVVTDSQAFGIVSEQVPRDVPLTSFSILFARHKGDLSALVEGARRVAKLEPGARVLIAEACTHHPIGDDIGRVKIPAWLEQEVGGKLRFSWASGASFPEDLARFDLVVHCGGCMINRAEMLHRLAMVKRAGVPVVNYGVLIACLHGILDRALEPFVAAGVLGAGEANTSPLSCRRRASGGQPEAEPK
ncbi:MAG: [FeFe] hydrogenase H-cluster maturation GTPase HydF [Firmicutes bacterium]|jgi:[FeFe] hydrogenase H-cluster maturation GTPase HydF|nr:[FeFe] hydrogenase H-cluster maturation GTPase HydF [Bacillota bacterium]MDH7496542.1 [FeFe] hydrogenase H-cluster maturation GTPase HydF [Bacillota bacterium]